MANSYKVIFLIFLNYLFISLTSSGQEKNPSTEFSYHSVKKKETIYSIAKEHGVTPEDIYRYNPSSRESIKTGEVLQIPQKNKSPKNNQVSKEIFYKVNKGESLYFIAKKFSCSQEDILKLNPGYSRSTIRKGMILKVPGPDYSSKAVTPKSSGEGFTVYKVQSGDTYFNLKKRFGAEKEELEKINPELKNGLQQGLMIRIPVHENVNIPNSGKENLQNKENTTDETDLMADKKNNNHLFSIGLYLPFRCELNDSSTITLHTVNYLEFYEGALLAAENFTKEGTKLKLYVYDTNQDPKVIEQLVKKPEFLSLDLIIGPVYADNQKTMSQLSGKNHIPMVSPLSPDGPYVFENPYYYQINPDRKIRLNGTSDYLIKEFQGKNIILLGTQNGNNGSNVIASKLKLGLKTGNFQLYDLWNDDRSGIENKLAADQENIVILTDLDEAKVSVAITRLNTVSKKFRITLVGMLEYTRMKSINMEYLHNLNFLYLSPYFINYNSQQVVNFIEKFRSDFSTEPSQYAFQGYDVITGFIKGLKNSGKKFMPAGTGLLQADYNFQRVSAFGGYMNMSFFIIKYTDSYEIRCEGKINGSL